MKVKEYFEMYKKSRAFDNRENGLMSAFCNVKTVFSKQKPHSTNTNYYLLWPLRYCQTCCIKKRQLIEKNESSETLTSLMCVQWPKIDPPIGQNFTSKALLNLHQPGHKSESVLWQGSILPLDHLVLLDYIFSSNI